MDLDQYLKNLTPLRQKQLKTALFVNLVDKPEDLTTFSKFERESISREFPLRPFKVKAEQKSADGSTKWAFELADGKVIETVLMEFRDERNTVCISSQAGCPGGCLFCATGQMGFKRNLTTWEILAQVLFAARYIQDHRDPYSTASDEHLTNVVFMGMGEPLLNLDNVLQTIKYLNDPDYFNLGRRHITVSTFGPTQKLKEFIDAKTGTTLAISLHAPNQKLRETLMPATRANTLFSLMQSLDDFVLTTNKRVSYEYLLIKGVNDSEDQAKELVKLLSGKLAFVNLIAYNPTSNSKFQASPRDRIERFKKILVDNRIQATVRVSLGDEISAACGQLAGR
jgi:23S rRNA (adenine2503-C2)-methyltransferase